MMDLMNEILYLSGSISHDEYMNNILLNEMKMSEVGIQLASTELWKAIQQIMDKAINNKTKNQEFVIPTTTEIKLKINDEDVYFPICVITGKYDTKKLNSNSSQIYGGLKHFSAHFNNIKKLFDKNYRDPNVPTNQASFDSFCEASKKVNEIISNSNYKPHYIYNKYGKIHKLVIYPTIQYGNDLLTFEFVIRLPKNKNEIAFLHTFYPTKTCAYDRKSKKNKDAKNMHP